MENSIIISEGGKEHFFDASTKFVIALDVSEDNFSKTKLVYETSKGEENFLFFEAKNVDIWEQIQHQRQAKTEKPIC